MRSTPNKPGETSKVREIGARRQQNLGPAGRQVLWSLDSCGAYIIVRYRKAARALHIHNTCLCFSVELSVQARDPNTHGHMPAEHCKLCSNVVRLSADIDRLSKNAPAIVHKIQQPCRLHSSSTPSRRHPSAV